MKGLATQIIIRIIVIIITKYGLSMDFNGPIISYQPTGKFYV